MADDRTAGSEIPDREKIDPMRTLACVAADESSDGQSRGSAQRSLEVASESESDISSLVWRDLLTMIARGDGANRREPAPARRRMVIYAACRLVATRSASRWVSGASAWCTERLTPRFAGRGR